MNGWLSSFDRKKHQRRVNQLVRQINKNIASDDLWRGRFVMSQIGSPHFYHYEDNSGASLEGVCLVITDLKTGRQVKDYNSSNGWCHFGGSKIWHFMNDAIIHDFNVWAENPTAFKEDPMYNFNNPKVRAYWKKEWVI